MFDILVYVFETYYTPQACPKAEVLAHKLAAIGFDDDEISEALNWLHGLNESSAQHRPIQSPRHATSLRIFTEQEYSVLGPEATGFIHFLESSGALAPNQREVIIERALAIQESPVPLYKIKIIALMVLWSHEAEIEHLIFEELITDDSERLCH